MQRSLFVLLSALALLLLAQPSTAQTTVYFTYTNTSSYPQVCGTGSLSCNLVTGSTTQYNCSSLINGTHSYYPSSTAPTFVTPFVTTLPATCHGYTANQLLPLTRSGFNLQYGSTCVNLYLSGGVANVNPDAVTGVTNFTFSTSPSGVASCPAVVPATTSSSSVTVGFVYTSVGGFNDTRQAALRICGAGNLQCTSYGSNEYLCPTLLNGAEYVYNGTIYNSTGQAISTPTLNSYTLSNEVECNSYGDGALPLNYEGISFGGNFPSYSSSITGCTSIYTTKTGQVSITYNVATTNFTTNTFTYSAGSIDPATACSSFIPGLQSSAATASASISLFSLFIALFIAVVAHSL